MKKYVIFMSICICFIYVHIQPIHSKTDQLTYRIYIDTNTMNSYDKKMEVFEILNMLCEDVDETSYYILVRDNLHLFEELEDCEVNLNRSKLSIYYKNATNTYIEGVYTYHDTCFSQEVEVKSSIFDFLFK